MLNKILISKMSLPQIEICIPCEKHASIVTENLSHLSNVTVSIKSLTSATHSILIVPGNCYAKKGEKGIAGFILNYLVDYGDSGKPDIIDIVKEKIDTEYGGYLPIGQSILISIDHDTYKHIVYMPLREDPNKLASLDNVYTALRGAMYILQKNKIMEASMPIFYFIDHIQETEITDRIREAIEGVTFPQ